MSDNRYGNRGSTRGGARGGAPSATRRPAQQGPQGRRVWPVWLVVVLDVLIIGLSLNVYALFHHVIKLDEETIALPGRTPMASASPTIEPTLSSQTTATNDPSATPTETIGVTGEPVATDTPSPTTTPVDEPVNQGMWGAKFADKFTGGEVVKTANSYKSRDISLTITKIREGNVIYHVTDVYIRNLENFKTGYSSGKYGGKIESVKAQGLRYNAIIAVNGDNYGGRYDGIVVRNGELKRTKLFDDVLVMYNDGTMKAIKKKVFNIESIKQTGAWQVWDFGPSLLDDAGQPYASFNRPDIGGSNPRTAIGYFEPGHYCFVLVDGRGESVGVKLPELAQIMSGLGCKVAYNLDGGRTSAMTFNGEVVNDLFEGGRSISDIIYIAENE